MKGKPKKTTESEGMYPQADPTAPGGMSKANLRIELAERHGVPMEESREMSWPDLIQAVIDGRLGREAEIKDEQAVAMAVEVMFPDDDDDDEFADYEAPEVEHHADGSEHDPIECLHNEHGGLFADTLDAEIEESMKDPEYAAAFVGEPEGDDTDDEVFDPEALFAEILAARAEETAANPPIFLGIPGIKDYVFDGHAGAGPSASERWMTCTMSLSASRKFLETLSPNQQRTFSGANLAARQGTTAHAVGEAKANHMLGVLDDAELDNTLLDLTLSPDEGEEFDDEMDEYVNEYVDLIKQYADERGPENILIEARVEAAIPLSGMHEGEVYIIRGSMDAGAMPTPEEPVLVGIDLKYGEGIYVDATGNTQLMIYLLGLLGELVDEDGNLTVDIEKIRLYIAQPRLGGIKSWELTIDELLDWRDDVLSPALTEALYGADEGATYNPNPSACQFCPARGSCPALAEQRITQAADLFDVIVDAEFTDGPGSFPETTSLTNERLAQLLTQVEGLVDLRKDLKEETQRRLHRGAQVPGYQLVNYTPPRKWKESAQDKIAAGGVRLPKAAREQLFTEPMLVTPTQAEKILGENYAKIEKLVDKPAKRPVVAPEGDRRKKWEGLPPEAMFADESTDEDRVRAVEEMFPDEG